MEWSDRKRGRVGRSTNAMCNKSLEAILGESELEVEKFFEKELSSYLLLLTANGNAKVNHLMASSSSPFLRD